MARAATGQIRFLNGKHVAYLRGEYLGSFTTEAEAREFIRGALKLDAGVAPDSVRLFGESWLTQRELDGGVRGIDEERSVWSCHIATAPFYDWPLKKVKPTDVTAWLLALSRKRKVRVRRDKTAEQGVVRTETSERLGRQTLRHARRILRSCFAAAVAECKCPTNPVADAKMPKLPSQVEEEEDEWSFLFVEEIVRLFEAIEAIVPASASELKPKTLSRLEQRRAFYRAVYAVAIYGGLRQGEIFGLHWEDVTFEARGGGDIANCLRVRRTRNNGRAPKTASSKRRVPMLAPLRAALDAWRRHGGVVKSIGKVFPADGSAGQGHRPKDLGGYFGKSYDAGWERRWRRQAGIREYVTFHDLRHTCASHLTMGTWGRALTPIEVAEWLGHSDLKTTKRYTHLAPGALAALVREMESPTVSRQDLARRAELLRQASEHGRR